MQELYAKIDNHTDYLEDIKNVAKSLACSLYEEEQTNNYMKHFPEAFYAIRQLSFDTNFCQKC